MTDKRKPTGKPAVKGVKAGKSASGRTAAATPSRVKAPAAAKVSAKVALTPERSKRSQVEGAKAASGSQPGKKAAAKVRRTLGEKPAAPVRKARPRLVKAARAANAQPSHTRRARFAVGDVVRHKYYPFRGVIFDIDPIFTNTEDWWLSIPENMRPRKDQPFYHLLAENAETEYIAYVSEQNLIADTSGVPVRHPQVSEYFTEEENGRYRPVFMTMLN